MNYCKLWQAIISADLEGIKLYSAKMGVGEYYGIFACMLAARTWDTVVSGMKTTPFSENEVRLSLFATVLVPRDWLLSRQGDRGLEKAMRHPLLSPRGVDSCRENDFRMHVDACNRSWFFQMHELRSSVSTYLSEISSVLNLVPRQLLLILKTNDLLRGIDHQLQTSKTSRSFVTMSKCCTRAVATEELKSCASWVERLMVYARWTVDRTRVALYQVSVQDYRISSEILASVAANLVSLLVVATLFGVG